MEANDQNVYILQSLMFYVMPIVRGEDDVGWRTVGMAAKWQSYIGELLKLLGQLDYQAQCPTVLDGVCNGREVDRGEATLRP
jgi:hypothetical protein